MKKAMVVSKTEQSIAPLVQLLNAEGYENIVTSIGNCQAKNSLSNEIFDLIVINITAGFQEGLDTAVYAAKHTRACVIVMVQEDCADTLSEQMVKYGVLVISKPVNKHLFHHYLLFTDYFKRRMLGILEENDKLKQMVEDLKIIDRAKCLLVQCLSMSEQQSHRYLEKQAMDMRMSKVEVAKQVLKTYENI